MFDLFIKTSTACSRLITEAYSTSFSLGIRTLHPRFRDAIYGIYGMVRYADEIVDTFHDFDKKALLAKFKADTYEAIRDGISLNPILQSYQLVVNRYQIPLHLTEAFFRSMEMDLYETAYGREGYEEYIYGSAEVVGLMCLYIFTEGDKAMYDRLEPSARALGAAFQKVNFLRDMGSDFDERGRVYFPGIDFTRFGDQAKGQIEQEIAQDFAVALNGIKGLPIGARGGVLLAYRYYMRLFARIRHTPASVISTVRIRVPNMEKLLLLCTTLTGESVKKVFGSSQSPKGIEYHQAA